MTNFGCKRPHTKYFRLCGSRGICRNYSTLPGTVRKQTGVPVFREILFTKTLGLCFGDPPSRGPFPLLSIRVGGKNKERKQERKKTERQRENFSFNSGNLIHQLETPDQEAEVQALTSFVVGLWAS